MGAVEKLRVDRSLDIRSESTPQDYWHAKQAMDALSESQVLELYLDEDEQLRRIPFGLLAEGHEIIVSEPASHGSVRLLVRKRPAPEATA